MKKIFLLLVFLPLCAAGQIKVKDSGKMTWTQGGIDRADREKKQLTLVFTADEYADGYDTIKTALKKHKVKAAFFFTGNFYRNQEFAHIVKGLKKDGHYLGPHSDKHLLYASWENRSQSLVSQPELIKDVADNYSAMAKFGIKKKKAPYFIPPYEWYNSQTSAWLKDFDVLTVNFTGGTSSNADYFTPDAPRYMSGEEHLKKILDYEAGDEHGLNGFMLLIHFGTHPDRVDKLYNRLGELIAELKARGYEIVPISKLIETEKK